jgi:two-component system response regulator FlrC
VLIVEDDADMRELLVETLERDGYLVLAASSATEASGLIQQQSGQKALRIDLVLSDVRMAGPTGIDLGHLLREARGATPLILMTAFPEPAVQIAAADLGASVLPKPFHLETLRRTVLTTIASHMKTLGAEH